jgi:hypothetical protein
MVHRLGFRRHPVAAAIAATCMGLTPAWAGVSTTGSVATNPGPTALGPGNTILPTTAAWVGNSAPGSILVDGGSFLQLARLAFGSDRTGSGTGLISGSGTRVEIIGDGFSNGISQRLLVGDWGNGQLTVNGGAVIDARANQSPCLFAFRFCDSFVGAAAGDTATLNIDGVGTQVLIGQNLFVAQPGLAVPIVDGYTYGNPGGTTRGTVNITGGALLSTDRATVGPRHWSTAATGFERNLADVNVSGSGSRWVVTGGVGVINHATGAVEEAGAYILTANDRNAWATINVNAGGVIEIQAPAGAPAGGSMNLTNGGGRTDMLVTGTGSELRFTGDLTVLQVGRRLGSATLSVLDGGGVTGLNYVSVGRDGSFGSLLIDGPGSLFSATRQASAAANNGSASNPGMDIGRNGTGVVTVANGGRLEILATGAAANGPSLSLGRDAASAGTLNITGAGSVVQLQALSALPGGGPTEAFNPFMRVGRDGSGTLNITQGGKLLMDGQAVSTVANSRTTSLFIGGTSSTAIGGKGVAVVSGSGSEIRMTGSDSILSVGRGPQSTGQLTVSDQASVSGMGLLVGDVNGVGVLKVDNASIQMSGQQTGDVLAGAFAVIGHGGGIGVATLGNGSVLHISNAGSAGAGLILGGTSLRPFGDGSLTLSGGSQIRVEAASGLAGITVGRDGSALMRVRGGSSVDIGDGNLYVARLPGSDGTLLASESSTITAGWVGVGRNKTTTGDIDGGTGTMVLINSTLNAQDIVIGTNGFLGGTGTITGNITNYGIFAPGNSPGTLEINGSFVAEAGSRMILEVESDGMGGFNTDRVIFAGGETLDLSQLNAEFRFLGATDPNAFQAQGLFDVDTFFQIRQADNSLANVAPEVFSTASFTAEADQYTISSFTFSAAGGASFVAAPVPEPESWAMLLAGLLTVGAWHRRRKSAA